MTSVCLVDVYALANRLHKEKGLDMKVWLVDVGALANRLHKKNGLDTVRCRHKCATSNARGRRGVELNVFDWKVRWRAD